MEEITEEYVTLDAIKNAGNRVAICADCAMGKSVSIQKYLDSMGADVPVLFVSCRIVHAHDQSSQYDAGNYQSIERAMWTPTDGFRQATTLNSLHKYEQFPIENGVLVLDELHMILTVFNSKTCLVAETSLAFLIDLCDRLNTLLLRARTY